MTRRPAILLGIACLVTAALGWSTGSTLDALPWTGSTSAATPEAAPLGPPSPSSASTSPNKQAGAPFTPQSQIEAILTRPLLQDEAITPATEATIPAIPTTGTLDFAHLTRIADRPTRHHCQATYHIILAESPDTPPTYRFTDLTIDGQPLPADAQVTWHAGEQTWQGLTPDPAVEHFLTTLVRRLDRLRQRLPADGPATTPVSDQSDADQILVSTPAARFLVPNDQVADGRYRTTSTTTDEISYQPQPTPVWDWRFYQRDESVLRAARLSLSTPARVSNGGAQ